jgi:hypothetical protein
MKGECSLDKLFYKLRQWYAKIESYLNKEMI